VETYAAWAISRQCGVTRYLSAVNRDAARLLNRVVVSSHAT
jgi:hypothetical protein